MDTSNEQPKKCFCARCFLPIDNDKVDIDGQSFHRFCSMCCVCHSIPATAKMFYGHVFCGDCFKTYVLPRFRGEPPKMHSQSWWMQFAPGAKESKQEKSGDCQDFPNPSEPPKRSICARCLQIVNDSNKVDIGGQCFHAQCARCYFCQTIPKNCAKIYYGQVFCEDCFHRHVLSRNRDNPSEFFRSCFEQWQNNVQFAENMREFMASNKEASPFIFMMAGQPPPSGQNQEWSQQSEAGKSATLPALTTKSESVGTWNYSNENQSDSSKISVTNESEAQEITAAAEKIEKLTKYLHERSTNTLVKEKKWKNYESLHGWIDLQDPTISTDCPKCLWQCGIIYVTSDLQKEVCCGDY